MRSLALKTGLLAAAAVLLAAYVTGVTDRSRAAAQDGPGDPAVWAQAEPARPGPGAAPAPAPVENSGRWLLGDLHVHVTPPDAPGHSTLTVATAIAGARKAGLDFVILTPHYAHKSVPPGPQSGDRPLYGQELVTKLAGEALSAPPRPRPDGTPGPEPTPIIVVSGWEYTREVPGHLGLSFVDVAALSELRGDLTARRAMELGGLVVVNHPFFRPVKSDLWVMKFVTGDRTWRPFLSGSGVGDHDWNAIEIWHDRSVLIERMHEGRGAEFPGTQMVRDSLSVWDRRTAEQRRRIVGVGGSDAHGKPPYTIAPKAMVSVFVEDFTADALRRGLLGARVTFGRKGGPAARDFAATSDAPGARAGIGDSLTARESVSLTWAGKAVLYEDGVNVGEFEGGTTRRISPPGSFHAFRIEKPDDSAYSNQIYANLPR